jgi:hypothetical protein
MVNTPLGGGLLEKLQDSLLDREASKSTNVVANLDTLAAQVTVL